jgi:hypothetical protein
MRTFVTVLVAATASVLGAAALVSADGGDSGRVHACVISGTPDDTPNVRIVEPDDSCPTGSTATHWAVQGPPGASGAAGPQGSTGPPPDATQIATAVMSQGGVPVESDENRARSKFNRATPKSVTATCPVDQPDVIGGHYEIAPRPKPVRVPGTNLVFPGGGYGLIDAGPVTVRRPRGGPREGWRVRYQMMNVTAGKEPPWRLTVYVKCMRTIHLKR